MPASLARNIDDIAGLLHRRSSRSGRRLDDSVGEQRKIHELSAVQREIDDPRILDHVADFGVFGLHQRSNRLDDCDFFCGGSDLEFEIETNRSADLEDDSGLVDALELGKLDRDGIPADGQTCEKVFPIGVAELDEPRTGLAVHRSHRGAG